ncbi:hydrogenase nickel incorporation protein HypB [Candidatus Borrarchaeum sp.]|uniref:hydrogenase nickel incorporation protein HypB n=1 Tax=Candidatus Borrarchaeum sp. TaxID=2846742 RepID=UPI00257D2393|nr:hydrogenase nickel incorporation protein HypB [Candidatus Borrarchaeum sp.]
MGEHEISISIADAEASLIAANNRIAAQNRALFDEKGIRVLDVVGAIGAGKTALIELLIDKIKSKYKIAAIAGDMATDVDSTRIRSHGVQAIQIETASECALTASFVRDVAKDLDLDNLDLLIIENVGNLICPSDFILGAHARITVVSVTEGNHVVRKHPLLFKLSEVAVINKMDLAEIVEANVEEMVSDALTINPEIKVIKTSAKTEEGVDSLIAALDL